METCVEGDDVDRRGVAGEVHQVTVVVFNSSKPHVSVFDFVFSVNFKRTPLCRRTSRDELDAGTTFQRDIG